MLAPDRIVFFGTPEFALPTLSALLRLHKVVAVVTQPDRPAGRGRLMRAPPVKQLAQTFDVLLRGSHCHLCNSLRTLDPVADRM